MTHYADPYIKTKYKISKRIRKNYPMCFLFVTFEADDRFILYLKQKNTVDIRWANLHDIIHATDTKLSKINSSLLLTFFDIYIEQDKCRFAAMDQEFILLQNTKTKQEELWDLKQIYKIFNIHINGSIKIQPVLDSVIVNAVETVHEKLRLHSIKTKTDISSKINIGTLMSFISAS